MTQGATKVTLPMSGGPAGADLYRCVHCGLWLQACPTYLELGQETDSPRGRLALMKAVHEGRAELTPTLTEHMSRCLQCRACEAVCPSGVPFGRVMEATRAQMMQRRPGLGERMGRWMAFTVLLPHRRVLRTVAWALKLYQKTGVQALVRGLGILRPIPRLRRMEEQLPTLPKFFSAKQATIIPGTATSRVGMLSGCIMPLALGPVNAATVRVLERNGCEVSVPPQHACCGALGLHSGEREGAKRLARQTIDAFLEAQVEAVVVNSAGCGSTMKEYGQLLADDPVYREKAVRFSALVKDVNEYLAALPLKPPTKTLDAIVTYQDSCHLAHAQRIREAPRTILKAIPGLRFVELPGTEICCGAAGVYNIVQPELSDRLLTHKMEHVSEVQPDIIATANPGCILQLQAGVRRSNSRARVVHVVELLDEAYE